MRLKSIPLALVAIAVYADEIPEAKPIIDPIFAISTKVEKDAYDNGGSNNVDDFWGRAQFGTAARLGNFAGEVVILAYPSGFGYELMRGIQSPEDAEILNDGTEKVARFDVHSAYITHTGKNVTFGIGRNILYNSNGAFFGNYVDEGPGGYFTGKGVYGNFVKFDFNYNAGSTSFAIGAGDAKINTGYLRLFQNFPITENGNFGLGVRTNVLNKVHTPDSAAEWNATALIDYAIKGTVKLYAEVGATGMKEDTEAKVPVLVGVSFPAGKVLDAVSFEVEYLKEDQRLEIGSESDMKKESPVMLGLDLKKAINQHFKFNAGLYTLREIGEMRAGLALNMSL